MCVDGWCVGPLKKFGPTSRYWSVDEWVLLSQQIRLKALPVMEQTCSQPLHSGALCQSYRLLGTYRQFRHHWTPPRHTCIQTCRYPDSNGTWIIIHFPGQLSRWVAAGLLSWSFPVSSIFQNKQHTAHQRQATCWSPQSNMSNVQLSLKDFESCQLMPAPHRSEARGVRECGVWRLACVITDNFQNSTMHIFSSFSLSLF